MEDLERVLDREVKRLRSLAYAQSTKATYKSQLKSYLDFCYKMNYVAVPATSETLCRYSAHLSARLKPESITQYLNVVRLLHIESGLPNPLSEDWFLKSLLKGIKRDKGCQVKRKLPITVNILSRIRAELNLERSQDLTFWAACLMAFYGMLRKSTLFPASKKAPRILVGDHTVHSWGMSVTIKYSKTIQAQERQAFISFPWHSNPKLCPSRALLRALLASNCSCQSEFIFTYLVSGKKCSMTHTVFTSMLRSLLCQLNLPLSQYSGHSFRRGGATHALMHGIPAEAIKSQGDWKSLAYLDYLEVNDHKERANILQPMFNV